MDHMLIWWAYVVKIIFVHKFLVIWFFFFSFLSMFGVPHSYVVKIRFVITKHI